MKKLILVIVCLLLLVGCGEEEDSFTITLDINPSLEIVVENEKAMKITALSDDAKDLVNKRMQGRLVESAFEDLIKRIKEQGLLDGETLNVIIGIEDKENEVIKDLRSAAKEGEIRVNIITPDITEEAKTYADKYKITPAKAAYILEIVKANEDLKFEDMVDKTVRELSEMKTTNLYCEEGYSLRDGNCEKVIKIVDAEKGSICPEGYQQVKGKCYMIGVTKHEAVCKDGFELKGGRCIGTERIAATASCSNGAVYNKGTLMCESLVYVSDIVEVENEEGEKTETCPNGGSITISNRGRACYNYVSSAPKYTCSKGKLDGTECVIESGSKEPTLEVVCDKGLTKYKDFSCLDYREKADHVTGYTCKSGARLEKNKCVYYKVVAAKEK
jgi:hypothetical protein